MLRENSPLLSMLALGLLMLMVPAGHACFAKMMSCPHYAQLSQRLESVIPIPSPTNLDVDCKLLTDGLSCVSRTLSTPECRSQGMLNTYNGTLQAVFVPCRRARNEFVMGQACWNSQSLIKKMLTDCYLRNVDTDSSNYCSTMLDFNRCVNASILNVTGCGEREQKILMAMAILVYNTNGQSLATPCPLQRMPDRPHAPRAFSSNHPRPAAKDHQHAVPSWQETTTMTTITTASPSPSTTATSAKPQAGATTPADHMAKDSLEATSPATTPTTKTLLSATNNTAEGEGGQKRAQLKSAASTSNGSPVVRASVSLWPLAAWCLVCSFLALRAAGVRE